MAESHHTERPVPRAARANDGVRLPLLPPPRALRHLWAALTVVTTTALSFVLFPLVDAANIVLVYLLAVVLIAAKLGKGPAILATVLAVASYVYFFVPHYYSFVLSDLRYLPTFAIMLWVGLMVATLTARLRAEAEVAHEREVRAQALYQLSRELAEAEDRASLATVLRRHVTEAVGGSCWLFERTADGDLVVIAPSPAYVPPESVHAAATSIARRMPLSAAADGAVTDVAGRSARVDAGAAGGAVGARGAVKAGRAVNAGGAGDAGGAGNAGSAGDAGGAASAGGAGGAGNAGSAGSAGGTTVASDSHGARDSDAAGGFHATCATVAAAGTRPGDDAAAVGHSHAGARTNAASSHADRRHGQLGREATASRIVGGVLHMPLTVPNQMVGMLCVGDVDSDLLASVPHRRLLDAFANNVAIALHRLVVHEEARVTQQRIDQERLRNVLLSSMSHDFRTPLASITGAVTTLLDSADQLEPEVRRDLMLSIRDDAEGLERQVRNLLDLTRLESGTLVIRREWHPLEEVVGCALARVEPILAGRDVCIDVPADLPLVPIDGLLVEQLLVNLLENAIKHTPVHSPIDVLAFQRDASHLVVGVGDRGPGVRAEDRERVFTKFHRARATRPAGAGLGLAICRAIAHLHGGRIWVEERAGGGASFLLELPIDVEQLPAAQPEADRQASGATSEAGS